MGVARVGALEQLATRLLQVEDSAFTEFAAIFGPRFRAFFLRRGLSPAEAEDLAVSSVTDIALKIQQYDAAKGSLGAWVFTLAFHALVDWRRNHPRTVVLDDRVPQPSSDSSEPRIVVVLAVREALAQLSDSDQLVVRLKDFSPGSTYADIADQLGIRPTAARVRHLRALRRLKSILMRDPRFPQLLRVPQSIE